MGEGIIWYGPHECAVCGVIIVKAGIEFGGAEYEPPALLMRVYSRGSECGNVDLVYPMIWEDHEHSPVWQGGPRNLPEPATPTSSKEV